MSRAAQVAVYLVAGLVAPFLSTMIEAYVIALFPAPSSKLVWRATQTLAGVVSSLALVAPLVHLVRPAWPASAFAFVAAFLGFQLVATVNPSDLLLLFQLPDTWSFLLTSVLLIWIGARRREAPNSR